MCKKAISLVLLFAVQTQAQVLDVNGDGSVGPHEAIAVAEEWKGPASAANDHNHLGQTWAGNRNPLTIRGNFPDRSIIVPGKEGQKASGSIPSAPLILDNTAVNQSTGLQGPDLLLRGDVGIIAANQETHSVITLRSNRNISLLLDCDDNDNALFLVRNGESDVILNMNEAGDLLIAGSFKNLAVSTRIDHPLDPANKYLVHSSVESPDMKNVYDGVLALDENGEATVSLPNYFEAFNSDFRYQLTCIGGFAPVYVDEEIRDNHFKVAGGKPGMKVSWMVTGIRQDAYAKANPIDVERMKSVEEKRKYLHPELLGEPVEKSVGLK